MKHMNTITTFQFFFDHILSTFTQLTNVIRDLHTAIQNTELLDIREILFADMKDCYESHAQLRDTLKMYERALKRFDYAIEVDAQELIAKSVKEFKTLIPYIKAHAENKVPSERIAGAYFDMTTLPRTAHECEERGM